MRIISGKLRGRKLISFSAEHIRPTTDRVKESIFNKLAFSLKDADVLDLYSGTGNLSIEAYSWGARSILCVESHLESLKIINKNIEALDIGKHIQVMNEDVFRFLKNFKTKGFDVIFVDPPFTEKIADKTMRAISQSKVFSAETIVVIESSSNELIQKEYDRLFMYDQKKFGDKVVSYFKEADS